MVVLVAYASAHGSTRGIAERVATGLESRGIEVALRPVDDVATVEAYDAFVIGSAIHDGKWLPEAVAFTTRQATTLDARPLWLFSVSLVGDTTSAFRPAVARRMRAMMKRAKRDSPVAGLDRARGSRWFAGAIAPSHWPGATGRAFFSAMGGRYGDHRDWADIDAWTARIAAEVRSP